MPLDTRRLPAGMAETLGYYVYLYTDPESNKPFYVGKGYGNRCLAHLNDKTESEKVQYISRLRTKGLAPRIEILIHGLDEATALRIEMSVIDVIGIGNLTNEIRGFESGFYGRIPLEELIAQIEQPPVEILHPVLLIRINQMYYYGISEIALYEATRGPWKLGEHRKQTKYAFAVYDGIVREVYEIDCWHRGNSIPYKTRVLDAARAPKRWEFSGNIAPSDIRDRYMLKSVREYLPANTQNPVRYVNC